MRSLTSIVALCLPLVARAAALAPPPETPKKPVTDTYHGVSVTEDYRWLEDWNDPEVKKWSEAQNRRARDFIEHLPDYSKIAERVKALESDTSPDYRQLKWRRGVLFALKVQPPKQQPMLVTLRSADDLASERVILDPNQLDPGGGTAIDFYVPSLDAKKVAVSLSQHGSEDGTVHVYEVATGKELGDTIPRVNFGTAGGSLAWNADATGFYYTRYPRGNERPPADRDFYQQIDFHRLGEDTAKDRYSLGKEFPRIAEIELRESDDGRFILATVANGDGGEFAHYLYSHAGQDHAWAQVTRFSDQATEGRFGPDGTLYLLSRENAPLGRILRIPPGESDLRHAQTVIPEGPSPIADFQPTSNRIYVVERHGGPSEIRIYDQGGHEQGVMPILPISSIGQVVRMEGDEVLFRNESWVHPPAWYFYRPTESKPRITALKRTSIADFSDTEVVREMATSKDGTRVPINILRRKHTKLKGQNPTILTGYGGYGISRDPIFSPLLRLWLEQGVVYAIANLRGGGEFGEPWHKAGNLLRKQNVFDDFAACARYLIETGYTNPKKLGIIGGSNGGLLMGAALTQHPESFKAVVARVGIFDMLRVELSPNGAFNTTEFGSVKDPAQFKALYAYSPYHHVKDNAHYPAVLFATGEHDPRVDPMNSRKMVARLQAASPASGPFLLRTTSAAGHGIGTSLNERIAESTDIAAFFFYELGIHFKPEP